MKIRVLYQTQSNWQIKIVFRKNLLRVCNSSLESVSTYKCLLSAGYLANNEIMNSSIIVHRKKNVCFRYNNGGDRKKLTVVNKWQYGFDTSYSIETCPGVVYVQTPFA